MGKPNGIAVLFASNGRHTSIHWSISLRQLVFPIGIHQFWNVSAALPGSGHTRADQREALFESAQKVNAEFAMLIDDDTICPSRTIQELYYVLSQNPKAAICGGIYCTKSIPPEPIVFKEIGGGPFWNWTIGDVFKCAALGTGCMMVRLSVLKDIPRPWFKDTSEANLGETASIGDVPDLRMTGNEGTDDIYFCKKVRDAGFDIIAHGGVLPVHMDYDDEDKIYKLPTNCYPVVSYQEKLDAYNAAHPGQPASVVIPENKKVINL